MRVWLDAQLAPSVAAWIAGNFQLEASAVRELGLHNARDLEIFQAARQADAVVITKDEDFVRLLERFGPPPSVIWLRCGNTSNARLRQLLNTRLESALDLIVGGEPLVEITDPW